VWIDLQGRVMRQRQDRGDLLRIQADSSIDGPPGQTIDGSVVNGALQLHQLLPDVRVLRYHPERGLGFNDPRGWEAWLGTGLDMPQKIVVYNAIVAELQGEGFRPNAITVADPADHRCCCRPESAAGRRDPGAGASPGLAGRSTQRRRFAPRPARVHAPG